MTHNIRIPVHCCCNGHLIGYLTINEMELHGRSVKRFLRRHPRYAYCADDSTDALFAPTGSEYLEFEIAELHPFPGEAPYKALKSRDFPIEQVKRIAGFREDR